MCKSGVSKKPEAEDKGPVFYDELSLKRNERGMSFWQGRKYLEHFLCVDTDDCLLPVGSSGPVCAWHTPVPARVCQWWGRQAPLWVQPRLLLERRSEDVFRWGPLRGACLTGTQLETCPPGLGLALCCSLNCLLVGSWLLINVFPLKLLEKSEVIHESASL